MKNMIEINLIMFINLCEMALIRSFCEKEMAQKSILYFFYMTNDRANFF